MIVVGLCGGSGSGKSAVAKIFLEYGIPSIDADAVYRELTIPGAPLLSKLASTFGDNVITNEGTLDRKALRAIVFSDKSKLTLLNSVTHGAIIDETEKIILDYEKQGYTAVIFDAPQLFESGFNKKCNFIITVTAPFEERLKRLIARDSLPEEVLKQRLLSQLSDDFLKANSDFVIDNNGDFDALAAKIKEIVKIILK